VTDRLINRFPLYGALALGLALGACSQGAFEDESVANAPDPGEGNLAKSMLISMGAIDDPHAAAQEKFQPRPPLVVPPKKTLPAPVDQDASLAANHFPVNPEVREEKERAERLKNGGSGVGDTSARPLTLSEQARFKDLPSAGAVEVHQSDRDLARTLKPWELDGSAQAAALEKAQNSGPVAKERSLLSPPEDYRTPSSKAPLESPPQGVASLKPSWWPF
jgi:hypothetical protein